MKQALNIQPHPTALHAHIQDMQTKAMRIDHILEAVNFMASEAACAGARSVLTQQAQELAKELNDGLDSANLPEAV